MLNWPSKYLYCNPTGNHAYNNDGEVSPSWVWDAIDDEVEEFEIRWQWYFCVDLEKLASGEGEKAIWLQQQLREWLENRKRLGISGGGEDDEIGETINCPDDLPPATVDAFDPSTIKWYEIYDGDDDPCPSAQALQEVIDDIVVRAEELTLGFSKQGWNENVLGAQEARKFWDDWYGLQYTLNDLPYAYIEDVSDARVWGRIFQLSDFVAQSPTHIPDPIQIQSLIANEFTEKEVDYAPSITQVYINHDKAAKLIAELIHRTIAESAQNAAGKGEKQLVSRALQSLITSLGYSASVAAQLMLQFEQPKNSINRELLASAALKAGATHHEAAQIATSPG